MAAIAIALVVGMIVVRLPYMLKDKVPTMTCLTPYELRLIGPLFSDEGMRQEQSMAACFRRIAPRFASSPAPHSSAPRAAA